MPMWTYNTLRSTLPARIETNSAIVTLKPGHADSNQLPRRGMLGGNVVLEGREGGVEIAAHEGR
eukprot:10153193-Alexandrium_andersonii.AAC.1